MKINIAIISPKEGIGGGNRKYAIYFKYLSEELFNKYYLKITDKSSGKNSENELNEKELLDFIEQKNIQYVYMGNELTSETYGLLRKKVYILKNVNFTQIYNPDSRVLNLIISKTDWLKIKLIHGKLVNDYVVYNPIDFDLWTDLAKNKGNNYMHLFGKEKIKFIVGRLARTEPSKWEFLMIKTLLLLQKRKNYNYGFVFAGMPGLYRAALKILLNKKMKSRIVFLPELKQHEELAKFYSSIDLFWQTSHIGESFGNVIAESFCFNVPVITDHKKFLKKNGAVNRKKYDAQIEVVDDGKNGAYCNNPYSIIEFLEKSDKASLKKLGANGHEKVRKMYDARIAGQTMARILYDFLRKNKKIARDKNFEKIQAIPSQKEIGKYHQEYIERIGKAVKIDEQTRKNYFSYRIEKTLWLALEWIYLLIRKIFKIIKIDIEKFNPNVK